MKLRLKNIDSNETLKITVPDTCTIPQLKQIISSNISINRYIYLSLNRKDEISANSINDSLKSIGIVSGDRIFFSVNDNIFIRSQTLGFENIINGSSSVNNLENDLIVENKLENEIMGNYELGNKETLENDKSMQNCETGDKETLEMNNILKNNEIGDKETVESRMVEKERVVVESDIQIEDIDSESKRENTNMDIDSVDDQEDEGLSVPGFLRKVFNKEFGDNGGCDRKLVVIAVHAVLVESGFVTFDPVSKTEVDGLCLSSTRSLCYTLADIVESSGVVKSVVVKVQSLGKDVIFYGSLAGKSLGTYRVRFDGERLAIVLNLMWANVDMDVERSGLVVCPEKEVLEFWKTVKDKLWLPLLSDLCEVANLPPPPNFTRLPTDMKLMILELLPGVDLAKATCVSRELQFLSSNDALWKQKYLEQYGDVEVSNGSVVENSWKRKFVKAWQARKRSMRVDMVLGQTFRAPRIIRPLPLIGNPRIIGGHHDLYPNIPGIYHRHLDLTPNIGIGGLMLGRNRGRNFLRNFAPQCNFGNRNT